MNKKVLERFVSDYKLPIRIYSEPYFSYLLDLYESTLKSRTKFELLQKTLKGFESDESFLNYYSEVRDSVIKNLNENPAFIEFNKMNMDKYDVVNKKFSRKHIFKGGNEDKYYVSIDLVKANYQSLSYINKEIVLNTNTYDEFLSLFTDCEYMLNSKYLRQVIFGNINPKRQVKIQRYMMEIILNKLIKLNLIEEDKIRSVSNDEIIYEVEDPSTVMDLMSLIKSELGFDVDVEVYYLTRFLDNYYAKNFYNKEGSELMCIPQVYHAVAHKTFYGLPINDYDLTFFYENKLAKFVNVEDVLKCDMETLDQVQKNI